MQPWFNASFSRRLTLLQHLWDSKTPWSSSSSSTKSSWKAENDIYTPARPRHILSVTRETHKNRLRADVEQSMPTQASSASPSSTAPVDLLTPGHDSRILALIIVLSIVGACIIGGIVWYTLRLKRRDREHRLSIGPFHGTQIYDKDHPASRITPFGAGPANSPSFGKWRRASISAQLIPCGRLQTGRRHADSVSQAGWRMALHRLQDTVHANGCYGPGAYACVCGIVQVLPVQFAEGARRQARRPVCQQLRSRHPSPSCLPATCEGRSVLMIRPNDTPPSFLRTLAQRATPSYPYF